MIVIVVVIILSCVALTSITIVIIGMTLHELVLPYLFLSYLSCWSVLHCILLQFDSIEFGLLYCSVLYLISVNDFIWFWLLRSCKILSLHVYYWSSLFFSLSLSIFLTVCVSALASSYFHFVVSLIPRSLSFFVSVCLSEFLIPYLSYSTSFTLSLSAYLSDSLCVCTHLICFHCFAFIPFFLWHWFFIDIIMIMLLWLSYSYDHDW